MGRLNANAGPGSPVHRPLGRLQPEMGLPVDFKQEVTMGWSFCPHYWPACLVHHVLCQFARVNERWSEHVAAVSTLCVLVACFSSQLPGLSHQVVVLLHLRKVKSFLVLPRHSEGKAGGADQGLPKWKCFLLWHLLNLPAHCLVFITTVVWTLTRSCSHLNNQGWITMVKDVCASEQTIDKGF